MNTLIGYDLVPEPKIIEAALRACRRLNDLASAIRILEAVKVRENKSHRLESPGCFQAASSLLVIRKFIPSFCRFLRIKLGHIRKSTHMLSRS